MELKRRAPERRRNAVSPRHSPAPRIASSVPPRVMRIWPRTSTKKEYPGSSSPTSCDPARTSNQRAIGAASARHCASKRSEEHTSELQSLRHLVCRLLLEKKKTKKKTTILKQKKKQKTTNK